MRWIVTNPPRGRFALDRTDKQRPLSATTRPSVTRCVPRSRNYFLLMSSLLSALTGGVGMVAPTALSE